MSTASAAGVSWWHWLGQHLVFNLHIGDGFAAGVDWLTVHGQGFFDGVSAVIGGITNDMVWFFNWLNPVVVMAFVVLFALWRISWQFALTALVGLWIILCMSFWRYAMDTLGLVVAATAVALLIGLPLGVAMAKSSVTNLIVRPVLDFMQTLPPFVYLIPAVVFFGTGRVPGVIATFIFCMPPSVRLMNLGIRHVPAENVEAGRAFGCNPLQLLLRVELPLATPSIMAGINQTIMLALSMTVIASFIGAGGLGDPVVTGLQQLRTSIGFNGGLGVVIIAILLDRLTQSLGTRVSRGGGIGSRIMRVFGGKQSD